MANNPDQEREAIRMGFAQLTDNSVRPLRAAVIALGNGHPVPPDTLARLIEIEEQAFDLRVRNAVLNDLPAPERPDWLDPAPAQ